MSDRLRIPSAISYVRKSDIVSFTSSASGSCKVEVDAWITLDFVKGSVAFETDSKKSAAGKVYTAELSANIREDLNDRIPAIFKLEFEDSETLIIGDNEHLVDFDIETSLTRKRLKFSHKNWHPPYKLVP